MVCNSPPPQLIMERKKKHCEAWQPLILVLIVVALITSIVLFWQYQRAKDTAQNIANTAADKQQLIKYKQAVSRILANSGATRDAGRQIEATIILDAILKYKSDHNEFPPAIMQMPYLSEKGTNYYSCTNGINICPAEICSSACSNGVFDLLESLGPYLATFPKDPLAEEPGTGYGLIKDRTSDGETIIYVVAKYHETTNGMIIAPSSDDTPPTFRDIPQSQPPVEDAGVAYMEAMFQRWKVQCEDLVQKTGRPCNCDIESSICIIALGGVPN